MSETEDKLRHALEEREKLGSLRELRVSPGLADFCSNDYLGFSRAETLREMIAEEVRKHPESKSGSTGSRLISGNSSYCEELESFIAGFHGSQSGLIFNSGYDANLGLFSSVPQRNDTILYDKLVHASIRDGIRLSHARAFSFEHNDVEDLERRIKSAGSSVYVAVESVYSMDGDCAPLSEMAKLCRAYGANLIVDEAHATGVFGRKGEGLAAELGLTRDVFARVHTFGKALGTHGAVVLGSETLRSYLINFARSFIYTTALPFHSLAAIRCAYEYLLADQESMERLAERVALFKRNLTDGVRARIIESQSAIQCVVVPGNAEVKSFAHQIQVAGYDVRPIMHPTVPAGSERLRVCLHAFNTEEEILGLTNKLGMLT